ncbi:GAF domain nucleotide-binding protein [Atractiella rhizophila]|nr:GAF domain nucleotide-binding protein [Atractiella rhizophila]
MPHADSSRISPTSSKAEFYSLLHTQLRSLLADQRNVITNASNLASLVYWALHGEGRRVNWCGFYFVPFILDQRSANPTPSDMPTSLLLGPFHGRPACQSISLSHPKKEHLGVCADAFLTGETVRVANVEQYPGHIACDGETKSEIVLPILVGDLGRKVGVFDLDCEVLEGWDEEDQKGLLEVVRIFVECSDWGEIN